MPRTMNTPKTLTTAMLAVRTLTEDGTWTLDERSQDEMTHIEQDTDILIGWTALAKLANGRLHKVPEVLEANDLELRPLPVVTSPTLFNKLWVGDPTLVSARMLKLYRQMARSSFTSALVAPATPKEKGSQGDWAAIRQYVAEEINSGKLARSIISVGGKFPTDASEANLCLPLELFQDNFLDMKRDTVVIEYVRDVMFQAEEADQAMEDAGKKVQQRSQAQAAAESTSSAAEQLFSDVAEIEEPVGGGRPISSELDEAEPECEAEKEELGKGDEGKSPSLSPSEPDEDSDGAGSAPFQDPREEEEEEDESDGAYVLSSDEDMPLGGLGRSQPPPPPPEFKVGNVVKAGKQFGTIKEIRTDALGAQLSALILFECEEIANEPEEMPLRPFPKFKLVESAPPVAIRSGIMAMMRTFGGSVPPAAYTPKMTPIGYFPFFNTLKQFSKGAASMGAVVFANVLGGDGMVKLSLGDPVMQFVQTMAGGVVRRDEPASIFRGLVLPFNNKKRLAAREDENLMHAFNEADFKYAGGRIRIANMSRTRVGTRADAEPKAGAAKEICFLEPTGHHLVQDLGSVEHGTDSNLNYKMYPYIEESTVCLHRSTTEEYAVMLGDKFVDKAGLAFRHDSLLSFLREEGVLTGSTMADVMAFSQKTVVELGTEKIFSLARAILRGAIWNIGVAMANEFKSAKKASASVKADVVSTYHTEVKKAHDVVKHVLFPHVPLEDLSDVKTAAAAEFMPKLPDCSAAVQEDIPGAKVDARRRSARKSPPKTRKVSSKSELDGSPAKMPESTSAPKRSKAAVAKKMKPLTEDGSEDEFSGMQSHLSLVQQILLRGTAANASPSEKAAATAIFKEMNPGLSPNQPPSASRTSAGTPSSQPDSLQEVEFEAERRGRIEAEMKLKSEADKVEQLSASLDAMRKELLELRIAKESSDRKASLLEGEKMGLENMIKQLTTFSGWTQGLLERHVNPRNASS